jgi:NAD(P)-dependent dehydrogenase (short-subunit alcohol dehydrogenase family)
MKLEAGKVAVVTGAASGIGLGLGAWVAIGSRHA